MYNVYCILVVTVAADYTTAFWKYLYSWYVCVTKWEQQVILALAPSYQSVTDRTILKSSTSTSKLAGWGSP